MLKEVVMLALGWLHICQNTHANYKFHPSAECYKDAQQFLDEKLEHCFSPASAKMFVFYFRSISMVNSISRAALALSLVTALGLTWAADKKETAEPAVKKSDSGVCHDKTSPSFGNTKKFTAFASIEECVKSGGKLPAGQTAAAPAAPAAPVVKKSDSGICHDAKSPSYERTKKFTEFKTLHFMLLDIA
jgi:hypothetical protein